MADELVQILTTLSIAEGEIASRRLESEGIPVLLKGGGDAPYPTGPLYVFVPAAFEGRARPTSDA